MKQRLITINGNKPLCIDLFCGLGGYAEGFLAEGYDVVGYDLERHDYGSGGYPGQLVLEDVLKLHGKWFKNATVIVASPPCQEFSYRSMPWKRAKAQVPGVLPGWWNKSEGDMELRELVEWKRWKKDHPAKAPSTELFDACFRIQREASEAAGHYIPMVVENVKGAQPWVGRAAWHYGSFYLWGDVPALMPTTGQAKIVGTGSWFYAKDNPDAFCHRKNGHMPKGFIDCGVKVPGLANGTFPGGGLEQGYIDRKAIKNNGGSWFAVAHNTESGVGQNPVNGVKTVGHVNIRDGFSHTRHLTNQAKHDPGSMTRRFSSGSHARKAASAQIAKIPFTLANHIAKHFKDVRKMEDYYFVG